MKINIPSRQPFSLSSVIHSHGWARLAPFRIGEEAEDLIYIFNSIDSVVVRLTIQEYEQGVSVIIDGDLSEKGIEQVTSAVEWMLALEEDFSEFYRLAEGEPKLQHAMQKAQGRLLRSPTLFEDVVKTILTTNTSWSGTIRMTETLVNQFGEPFPGSDDEFSFPLPEKIAGSDEQTLREITRLGYRAPYILHLAREVASGSFDLEGLKTSHLPSKELHKKLLAIKGVGNYAAANLMMLIGNYEYLTIDSWAKKMVSKEFYNGEQISAKEVEQVFEAWGKWRGLAYWLWDWSD
jgi:3-methyladenine DNA glycosylase/8-oxoguanine DNA glycosylase